MIDPKELRIGNLVHCNTNALDVKVQWPHPAQLIVAVEWPDGGGCEHVTGDLEEFEPIPLTPEWLERIGEKCNNIPEWEYVIRVGALRWYFRWNTEWYSEIGGIYIDSKVQYLHQAQNLYFSLIGKELTITSFNQSN